MAGDAKTRKQVAELQAAAEGVPSDGKLEFLGETFRLADKVGVISLLKYSHYAETSGLIGPAASAMYQVLLDTIHPDDWDRFEEHAVRQKAGSEDLSAVVGKCVEILTARPTVPPSGSSSGDSGASVSSTAT